jgi:UDP-N-acetylglucosamine transferase subunit ALG13
MSVQKPKLLVTVGTDHHPFDRLIRWVDRWAADGGSERADVFVQNGAAAPPTHVPSEAFLDAGDLQDRLSAADVVVCHAGPGSIMEARARGLVPIVVPRSRRLGEIVDEHQRAFSQRMDGLGRVRAAEDEPGFRAVLDEAVREPSSFKFAPAASDTSASISRLEELIDRALDERRPGRTKVLYIGGLERSGSTVTDRILGEVPGVCAVGEVVHLWDRGLADNQLCGCGDPFRSCDFWKAVGEAAFGGWDRLDPAGILAMQRAVDRHRKVPLMLFPRLAPRYRRTMDAYLDILGRLYGGIAKVAGAKVVVDSSKPPSFAFLLHRAPLVDLRVLHLVRDSRGVAHSSSKRVPRPEVLEKDRFMVRYGVGRTAGRWLLYNGMFELLSGLGVPTLTMRYEDLVSFPQRHVAEILRFAWGTDDAELDFVGDGWVRLGRSHTVSGNPMRFETGELRLKPDEVWRSQMDRRQARLVSALSWPLLLRYRYPVRRAR